MTSIQPESKSHANRVVQYGSIILQSFGYDVFNTQLLTMSQGAFLLLWLIFTVTVSMLFKNARCISIALLNLISLAGVLMIKYIPEEQKVGRLAGLWLIGGYASAFPTILSLVSSNITGHTKKSTVNGMLFLGFCTGYIVGPLTFLPQEAPGYKVGSSHPTRCGDIADNIVQTAFNIMIACFVLNVVIIISMRQIMARWNTKREQSTGNVAEASEDALAMLALDETDWENKAIRYSL